jgi:hypothetical protein
MTMLLSVATVLAASGTTDAPAAPGSTTSYTLEDIFQRLSNGTTASQSAFTEPAVAPGTGSMHSLNDIYAVIPDAGANVSGADGSMTFNIPNGIYRSKTASCNDTDLVAENVKHGVTLFGVTGTYTGPDWSLHSAIFNVFDLWSVSVVSDTDAWAMGSGGRIVHFDGSAWSRNTIDTDLHAVDMLNATDGWAVGYNGRIYHYSGSNWTLHSTTAEGSTLNAVDMLSATDGWAVGDYGRIYHYNGSSWYLDKTTTEGSTLYSISMLNATDGWAVGREGRVYHLDD